MKYNQTKHKFLKIFELSKFNNQELEKKQNEIKQESQKNSVLKNAHILYDSGWQVEAVSGGVTRTEPNTLGFISSLFVGTDVNLNLTEEMLAYCEYALIFKCPPEYKVYPSRVSIGSQTWVGNVMRVYGDSTLVFYGIPPSNGAVTGIHQQASTWTAQGIPLSFTKKAFMVDIIDTSSVHHVGYFKSASKLVTDATDVCLTNDNTTSYFIDHFDTNIAGGEGGTGTHEVSSITTSGVTGTGRKIVTTWADIQDPSPPDVPLCDDTVVETVESFTIGWNDANTTFRITQIPTLANGFSNSFLIAGSSISSVAIVGGQESFEVGIHAFYDSNRRALVQSFNNHLDPTPFNTGVEPGATYSTLKLTRNEFPDTDIVASSGGLNFNELPHENSNWKISKSTDDLQVFKIGVFGEFLAEGPATNPSTVNLPFWSDTYSGTDYVSVSHSHLTTPKTVYSIPATDIQWKLIISSTNPLYYKETRVHNLKEQNE